MQIMKLYALNLSSLFLMLLLEIELNIVPDTGIVFYIVHVWTVITFISVVAFMLHCYFKLIGKIICAIK